MEGAVPLNGGRHILVDWALACGREVCGQSVIDSRYHNM